MASGLTGCGVAEDAVAALTGLMAMHVDNRLQQAKAKRAIQRWLARKTGDTGKIGKATLLW